MVFTGGLVLPLYFERQPSDRLRPTFDADAVVACSSNARWAGMQAQLMQLGIMPPNTPRSHLPDEDPEGLPLGRHADGP